MPFYAGSKPMDWSGWWSWSKKCIQGTWYNPFALSLAPPPFLDEDMGLNCDFWISFTVLVNRWTHVSTDGVWLWFFYFFLVPIKWNWVFENFYWCTFNAVPAKKMLQRNLYRLPFVFPLLKLIYFQYFSK